MYLTRELKSHFMEVSIYWIWIWIWIWIGVQDRGAGQGYRTGIRDERMMQIREPFKVAGHGRELH